MAGARHRMAGWAREKRSQERQIPNLAWPVENHRCSPPASILNQGGLEKTGDGFRQLSRTLGLRRRERQTPLQAMTFDAKLLKEVRTPPQSVLGKYGVAEARFYQALDGFRVIRLHQHMRCHTDLVEKPVDDQPHVAALGIEQKWDPREFQSSHRADVSAAHVVSRGAHDEQLFVKTGSEMSAKSKRRSSRPATISSVTPTVTRISALG